MTLAARKSPEQFHKRFARLLRAFADDIEAEGVGTQGDEWIDQDHSPLGKFKHLELARKGVLKASKPDRKRVLIKKSDIDRHLEAHPIKVRPSALALAPEHMKTNDPDEMEAAMLRELGYVKKAKAKP